MINMNIDEILSKIYDLQSKNKIDAAIDVIMELFWDAGVLQDYSLMNEFLEKIDLSKITDGAILCSIPMNTFKYSNKVSNHIVYCQKAIARYKEMGYDDERIKRIMSGIMGVGNYWENMAALGAPEWLAGKKPE